MRTLLIDDFRDYGCDRTEKTFSGGIEALKSESWDIVYLDHDLGFYIDGDSRTGYDILCWLEQNLQYLPKEIKIVSDNPSGRERMELVLKKLYRRN
ncbi:MAG: hypothetical protein M0R00_06260 [Candidatus Omnitrophica bacterium]|jgi:hypothetical protein|nr:hypothetical protein [Candidatus Omnitrophota bacterium]